MDLTRWPRKKACLICCVAMLVLCMPCALGWSVLRSIQPFGEGSTVMDVEDFIVSNCLLPLGSLTVVLFCTRSKGWGWDNYLAEVNTGKGAKVAKGLRFYMTWVLPLIIIGLFLYGIYDFFFC